MSRVYIAVDMIPGANNSGVSPGSAWPKYGPERFGKSDESSGWLQLVIIIVKKIVDSNKKIFLLAVLIYFYKFCIKLV